MMEQGGGCHMVCGRRWVLRGDAKSFFRMNVTNLCRSEKTLETLNQQISTVARLSCNLFVGIRQRKPNPESTSVYVSVVDVVSLRARVHSALHPRVDLSPQVSM